MDIEDVKGFIIFTGIFTALAFIVTGYMGRQLVRVEKALKTEDKYVY